jgi:putative transposase
MPKTDSGASALASLLDGSSAGELIPELARHGLQQLIELEVAAVLGADRHERTEQRSGYRNCSHPRLLTTQVGDIPLSIPKLRSGSFFPTILEPRRRIDQALYAVIMEAWVNGVSTRKVDALVAAIGSDSGISRSEVSRICHGLDAQIQAFLERSLDGHYPYLYLDATYLHGRLGKTLQVCSRAVVVAMGVNADGRRELLGLKEGDSESEPFFREFLSGLKQRGLTGIRLVISDAHVGLTKAVGRMLQGSSWQRSRVHFARNLLQTVPKAQQEMVAAAAELMATAREDVLAFRHFPASHWRKLWSTNLLERVNEEIKRRTRVVGIFPNDASITLLVGAVLLEQDEHWQLEGRRMSSLDSMAAIAINADTLPEGPPQVTPMP